MSLVVAAIAAAGVGVAAGAVAVGAWLRRRAKQAAEPPRLPAGGPAPGSDGGAPAAGAAAASTADEHLSLRLGDMVQVEQETRWLCGGLRVREGATVRCALWFATEGSGEQPVLSFAAPDRHVYWLSPAEDVSMPEHPPSRVELAGRLVDRVASFPAHLEAVGRGAPALGTQAVITLYEGAVGDAAIAVHGEGRAVVYYGRRLEELDYDRLGVVDPAHGQTDP